MSMEDQALARIRTELPESRDSRSPKQQLQSSIRPVRVGTSCGERGNRVARRFAIPYRPAPMWGAVRSAVTPRTRHGWRSRLGLVVLLLVATACTTVPATRQRNALEPDRKGVPGATDGDLARGVTAVVVSSWLAAEHAFDAAALTADPDQPDLAATTVALQLGATQALLEQMESSGEVATGTTRYGSPTVRLVGSDLALVTSCLHDAEVVVSTATGNPVPGVLGQVDYELIRSTMELIGGGWKLASQTVGVGQCFKS
jgi:hypothetical protein